MIRLVLQKLYCGEIFPAIRQMLMFRITEILLNLHQVQFTLQVRKVVGLKLHFFLKVMQAQI